jgi:biotin synthase
LTDTDIMTSTKPSTAHATPTSPRCDWSRAEIAALFDRPLLDLLFEAQAVHRRHFAPNEVQVSALLSVKTGGCPEDCAYCPQSARYDAGVDAEKLMPADEVVACAERARAEGATRYCLGAAWREAREDDMDAICEMVRRVKALGLETCATLGMLDAGQARRLSDAGLDYYNHNLDTSPEHYGEIITTRSFDDRLATLGHVREAGMHVCCGGIVGLGESREDRVGLLHSLATLPEHPQSVPINRLVRIEGTPLADQGELDPLEFVRTIAAARILMPQSYVRLSAGRETMSDELQALAFMAGANSIFGGPRLLTSPNPEVARDADLLSRLGMHREPLRA